MGGGLLQLVAYGAQDVYLTGNPQITFFKVVYRRHTNFSIESIRQSFSGNFDFGNRVTSQISRNGDLVSKMILEVDLPKLQEIPTNVWNDIDVDRYVNYIGLRLIKSVELEIGGQKIDKQYSDWMYIWNELSLPIEKQTGYQTMVGADTDMTSFKDTKLYIPFEFWFCRNIGLALPLIALQYHEVKVNIEIETFNNCTYVGSAYQKKSGDNTITKQQIKNATLYADYIFLDTDERRRFAQLSHEYLIEQLQYSGEDTIKQEQKSIQLTMNHPVKELVWTIKPDDNEVWYNYTTEKFDCNIAGDSNFAYQLSNLYGDYSNLTNTILGVVPSGQNPVVQASLQLNGNDRFTPRDGDYFSLVQQYQHHTNISQNKGINVYSFALKPEEHQPSGTLNMSRIDTARLIVKSNSSGTLKVWGTNYNVLRILSGMGGLAYSN
tara:strand:- start:2622 stop:3926 length:1305 start_codon:yes stop_codon:yes gene_type:complete